MTSASIVSPEDQGATFVELFFDLVFVFAITQVTHYAAHHLDVSGILRATLVFWLIWWGWTQFTWALNAANTDHQHVRLGTLVSTGVAFVMAITVDRAFAEPAIAIWFGLAYVAVRLLGLGLYYQVLSSDADQRTAVVRFTTLSLTGLASVVVGSLLDPALRHWFWIAAIGFDMWAAWMAGNRGTWRIHPGHFAERHGLIVIIALGESLIVSGSALASEPTVELLTTGAIAVLMTCLLWWTYFGWVREVVEGELARRMGRSRATLARDAYSFWHFPLISGIIALAVGFEASLHPADFAATEVTVAVGAGLSLFLVSTAGALWRSHRCILWNRLIVLGLTLAALAWIAGENLNHVLGIGCAGLAVIVVIEQVTVRRRLEGE
jgi:low temperature requirement protein LtrA